MSNVDGSLASVVYGENINGDGAYVAVGAKGRVVRSEDGLNWTRIVLPGSLDKSDWKSVAYGGGKYVAVGTDRSSGTALAKLIESPDGLSWTEHAVAGSTLQKVRYVPEDAAFYAAGATWNGNNSQDQGIILRSADGETWSQWGNIPRFVKSGSSSSSAFYLIDFVKFKGKYVASTNLFTGYAYSTTGSSWTTAFATAILSDGSLEFSIYNNQLYANYNWQEGYISTDGVSFTRAASFDGTIGVGQSGSAFYRYGRAGKLDISTDNGVNWTPSAKISNISILSFASNGTSIVAVTAALNSLLVTADGNQWQRIEIDLKGVASGGGKWVAVGEAMPSNGNESADGGLFTSEAGFNQLAPLTGLPPYYTFSKIVYGEGRFVAGGSKLGSSEDGVSWATYDLPAGASGQVVGLEYGNGVFVAVTDADQVLTSPDGISWSHETEISDAFALNLAFVNGMFFAFDEGGVWTSDSNGASWTHMGSLDDYVTNSYYSFRDIAFDGSQYVLIAVDGNTGAAKALSSTDALTGGAMTWTEHEIDPAYSELSSMVYGDGYFVVVGTVYDADNNVHPGVYYSTDAENWISNSEQELGIAGSTLTDVYFKDGKFYAVGGDNAKIVLAKPAGGSGSTTFTVVNTNDSGTGSLRWAIAQAGAVADGQVVFDPALAGQTITLLSDLTTWDTESSNNMTIGDNSTNFTLTGLKDSNGKPAITVNGNGHLGLWARGSGTFSLSDIRFTGFDLNDADGEFNGFGSVLTVGGDDYSAIHISNVQFDHNAMTSGYLTSIASLAAISSPNEILLDRVVFADNELHALESEGDTKQSAVYVHLLAEDSKISNSLFVNNKTISNTSGKAYGGAFGGLLSVHLKVVNNTFTGNSVTNSGDGQAFGPVGYVADNADSSVDFYNNLAIGNKVNGLTVATFEDAFYNENSTTLTQDGNNLYTGSPFVDAAGGDFRLSSAATAAIDKGHDTQVIGTVDLDGNTRKQGDHVDIGAYESDPVPVGDGPSLASVLGQTDTSPGGGSGTAADPITWSINVANSVTKLDMADIVPAAGSGTVWFYDDPDYAGTNSGGFSISYLNLPEGDSATAYIQIDSSGSDNSLYYAVTIHRAAGVPTATDPDTGVVDSDLQTGDLKNGNPIFLDINRDAAGNLYTMVTDSANRFVFYKFDGSSWTKFTTYTPPASNPYSLVNRGSFAVDGSGHLHVGFMTRSSAGVDYLDYAYYDGSIWHPERLITGQSYSGNSMDRDFFDEVKIEVDANNKVYIVAKKYNNALYTANGYYSAILTTNISGSWQTSNIEYYANPTDVYAPVYVLSPAAGKLYLIYSSGEFSVYENGVFSAKTTPFEHDGELSISGAAIDSRNGRLKVYYTDIDYTDIDHVQSSVNLKEFDGVTWGSKQVITGNVQSGEGSYVVYAPTISNNLHPGSSVAIGADGAAYFLQSEMDAYGIITNRVVTLESNGTLIDGRSDIALLNEVMNTYDAYGMAVDKNGRIVIVGGKNQASGVVALTYLQGLPVVFQVPRSGTTPEAVPTATIDYANERLKGLVAGAAYTVDGASKTANGSGGDHD
ncbi:choice-of-anchor Q domain-containing protein [Cohnella rhizosphaerae]|uniref:Uncharacterized protein n=1 Tax=Cohnella rhizosphaerae TaxID=1457232 RepID=A0A9X4QTP0_9BACL|nr:choice-of-anchor Q domain-containing protein [Cohnella rhizosphaerae]MDG0810629.1 hypothetical protein [Cohnella rhizosphaerae]